MASVNQFNSMPENRSDGARDVSNPSAILGLRTKPSHLPLWVLFTEWGPTNRNMTDGAGRNQLYGAESFNPQSKYFNHQTMFANTVNATGNQGIYQRLLPEDAKRAGMRLWLDLLVTQVPEYVRGSDGKYLLDQDGNKQETGEMIQGHILKIVRTPMSTSMDGDFDTGNARYKARERYSFGVSDPLGIYGSPGSS